MLTASKLSLLPALLPDWDSLLAKSPRLQELPAFYRDFPLADLVQLQFPEQSWDRFPFDRKPYSDPSHGVYEMI